MAYPGGWYGRVLAVTDWRPISINCMYRTLLSAVALAFSSAIVSAETIFVPAGGDIIKAINLASDGDVIQLEAGLYQPYATIDTIGRVIAI